MAIEIKAAERWQERQGRGLHRLREQLGPDRTTCYGVYLGMRPALWDDVTVTPRLEFLKQLWAGQVLA